MDENLGERHLQNSQKRERTCKPKEHIVQRKSALSQSKGYGAAMQLLRFVESIFVLRAAGTELVR